MHFYRKCWFDPFEEQFMSPFFVRLPVSNAWNCHSLYTAFSSNVGAWGMWACSLFLSLQQKTTFSWIMIFIMLKKWNSPIHFRFEHLLKWPWPVWQISWPSSWLSHLFTQRQQWCSWGWWWWWGFCSKLWFGVWRI